MADKEKRKKRRAKKKLNKNKKSHENFSNKLLAGIEHRDRVAQGTFNVLKKLFSKKDSADKNKKEEAQRKTIEQLRANIESMKGSFSKNLYESNKQQGERIKSLADESMARERVLIDNADKSNTRLNDLTDYVKGLAKRGRDNAIESQNNGQPAGGAQDQYVLPNVPNTSPTIRPDNNKLDDKTVVELIQDNKAPSSAVTVVNSYLDDPVVRDGLLAGTLRLNPVTGELESIAVPSDWLERSAKENISLKVDEFIHQAMNPKWGDRQVTPLPNGIITPPSITTTNTEPLKWSFSKSKIISGVIREVNSKYNDFEFGGRIEEYVNKELTAYPIPKKIRSAYTKNKNIGDNSSFTNQYGSFLTNPSTDIAKQALANQNLNFTIGSRIPVGDYTFKINNLYGLRTGINKVKDRDETEHSGGVDIGVLDSSGQQVDYPVAIADGTIVDIHRDSSTTSKDGGYMITMQLKEDPSKVIRFMHLSGDIDKAKADLLGKDVTRGQVLFNKQGMSGSGTGDHIKITMNDYDATRGIIVNNHRNSINDPTGLVLTGQI